MVPSLLQLREMSRGCGAARPRSFPVTHTHLHLISEHLVLILWRASTTKSSPFSTLLEKSQVLECICRIDAAFDDQILVYKIPPLKANEGHRAGEWGDLAQPLWKGRLRFIDKGSKGAALMFEDGTTGNYRLHITDYSR